MKSRSKMQKVSDKDDEIRDWSNELPKDVLAHILSFLPIRDAIKTVQIRRFGDLWTLSPNLSFSFQKERFIDNVIKYHKNPIINSFELNILFNVSQDKLIEWTNFALSKETKELKYLFVGFDLVNLPPQVFRSECLVVLKLTGFAIELPGVVNLESLRNLVLRHVGLSDEIFHDLIKGCPRLKDLYVENPLGLRKVHFTAPSIETLYLDLATGSAVSVPKHYSIDCPNVQGLYVDNVVLDHLEVINVSSVCVCIIDNLYYFEDQDMRAMTVQHFESLLDKFRNADFFQLGRKSCQRLTHCENEYNETLSDDSDLCNEWTYLALRPGFRGSCLLVMFRLLGNSHMLEELIIYANRDFSCDCNELLVQEVFSRYDMHRLKNVSIREYEKPYNNLFQLIKFLLEKADTLENLVIACNKKDLFFSNDNQIFAMKLLSIPRASRNARVVFA